MDYFNDEMHQDMVDMYRDFAKNSCGPIAAEIDEAERFPEENVPIMGEMGLWAFLFLKNTAEPAWMSCPMRSA